MTTALPAVANSCPVSTFVTVVVLPRESHFLFAASVARCCAPAIPPRADKPRVWNQLARVRPWVSPRAKARGQIGSALFSSLLTNQRVVRGSRHQAQSRRQGAEQRRSRVRGVTGAGCGRSDDLLYDFSVRPPLPVWSGLNRSRVAAGRMSQGAGLGPDATPPPGTGTGQTAV